MNNFKFLTLIVFMFAIELNAQWWTNAQQQDAEMLKNYWNFRDRYRKFFTHIGKGEGNSIPAIKIHPYEGAKVINSNGGTTKLKGAIQFGRCWCYHQQKLLL